MKITVPTLWGWREIEVPGPPPVPLLPALPPPPPLIVGPCICPHCGHDTNKRASV